MNAELANLTKEIGRIAKTKSGSVEWDKVARLFWFSTVLS